MSHDKPFVKVTWLDAQDDGRTWVPADEIQAFTEAEVRVVSWGWQVGVTKKYVTLAADYIADGVYGRVTKIPKKMIQSIDEYEQ